ncbi:preprotein translocase subunit TatB [Achromobacter xylosoxidans]
MHATRTRRKPAFVALCVGAALSLLASLMSAVLWMGPVAGGVTGGGYRGQADYLLPVAGCLLALAVACAVGAFFKRGG